MTKKSKNEAPPKKTMSPKKSKQLDSAYIDAMFARFSDAAAPTIDKRKELLAKVAGSIAAGLVTSPSPSIATPSTMAMAAVDIAEEILKKVGISDESSAETSASSSADVGQAS